MNIGLKALAAATLISAAPLSADDQVTEIAVSYGDLNVKSPAAQEMIAERIKSKAIKACKVEPAAYWLPTKTDWDCVRSAQNDAVKKFEEKYQIRIALAAK